jgi:hypothetical protein
MILTKEEMKQRVEIIFTYHPPTPQQIPKYNKIREAAREFALVLMTETPSSADQSAALRLLRECVMTANASIALDGKIV